MSQAVQITLTDQEKSYLFDIVRQSIEAGLNGKGSPEESELPAPPTDNLRQPLGAFVTLEKSGQLRGCIGMIQAVAPLYVVVNAMAWAAAFDDKRFPPVTRDEMPDIAFEISVLGPVTPCPDVNQIEIGRHGILLESRGRRAVFLPQVPVEQGWSVKGTLEQLCRKAALPPGTWRDRTATVFWYEATVIRSDRH